MKVIKNWRIEPFAKVINDMTGGNPKIQQKDYLPSGVLPIIDQGQKGIAGYVNDLKLSCKAPTPCIIFGDHTKILKYVDKPFAMGADGTKILVTSDELYPKYAFYYLQQVRLPDNLGYSRHFKFLKECSIPFPSIPEQKRIAAILDKADAVRRKRQETIRLLDEFLRSVFLEMFGDPVRNEKGWDKRKLEDICEIVTGNTPPRDNRKNYGNFIEWIKSDNINTPFHFITKAEEYLSEIGLQKGRSIEKNSILMTCIAGSLSCIGNVALVDRKVAFNQQINGIIPKNINLHFLYVHFLISKNFIQNASTNSMKGMISKGILSKLEFVVPSDELQRNFQKKFLRYLHQRQLFERNLNEMKIGFNSMMQNAFRGEL